MNSCTDDERNTAISVNMLIAITGIGFSLVAIGIDLISNKIDIRSAFILESFSWIYLFSAVLLTGFAAVIIELKMRDMDIFRDLRSLNRSVVDALNPTVLQIAGISIAAGIGEELLFRGVFQPLIGIIPASLFFSGLHTGFSFRQRVYRVYFFAVFIVSMILGFLASAYGLLMAIMVHAVWDLIMLLLVRRDLHTLRCHLRAGRREE